MDDVDQMIWALEKNFWLGGADVYRRHLADEALMVFPGMVSTMPQTVESITNGPGGQMRRGRPKQATSRCKFKWLRGPATR
jgi:hypothetical protein